MNNLVEEVRERDVCVSGKSGDQGLPQKRLAVFGIFIAALSLLFLKPLAGLIRYATSDELYSHTLLIPFISIYLAWLQRRRLSEIPIGSSRLWSAVPFALGCLGLLVFAGMVARGWELSRDDYLAMTLFSFVSFLLSGFLAVFGASLFRRLVFPLVFLYVLVPFPTAVANGIMVFFQHTSADTVEVLFRWSGTPVFRDGLVFHLPDLTIEVAKQCSGIRSSLVLFITGLLSGHLFLRSQWKKTVMAFAFVPLGILRNAIRILTIALLSIYVDPGVIDGPLHHRGGPVFFVLSLVPLFLLLLLLRWSEKKRGSSSDDSSKTVSTHEMADSGMKL